MNTDDMHDIGNCLEEIKECADFGAYHAHHDELQKMLEQIKNIHRHLEMVKSILRV